jgi:hypothetical protein
MVLPSDGRLSGNSQGSSRQTRQIFLLYEDQELVMADTMQVPTAASTNVLLRDQTCKSGHVTRRQSAMKPVARTVFARLAKGLALALAVVAGIAVAPCSAAADETPKASRQASAVAAPSSPLVAGRQRILAHPTDRQTVDPDPATTYVEKLYKQLMRSTPP